MSANESNETCPELSPNFHEYMKSLSTEYVITFSVLCGVTVLLVVNYLEELLYLYRQTSHTQSADKARWLLAVYPLVASTAFVSLVAPRTSGLNDLVASIYVAVCVYIFVTMLIEQFGGPGGMLRTLEGHKVRLNAPPFCFCFCICCRTHRPFRRLTVQVLCTLIMQFVLVRPFLGYLVSVIWTDGGFGIVTGQYIGFVYTASTLLAIWSFAIVFDLCKVPLDNIHIRPKFFCLQLVLLITGVQRSVIEIFVLTGIIVCEPPLLPVDVVADRWNSMIQIGETLLLASVARIFYRHTIQVRKQQLAEAAAATAAAAAAVGRATTSGDSNVSAAAAAHHHHHEPEKKVPYHVLYIDEDYANCPPSSCNDAERACSTTSMATSKEELIRNSSGHA